jgi:hypothetical protein
MKKRVGFAITLIVFLLVCETTSLTQSSSPNHRITSQTIPGGGGAASSTGFSLFSSVAQTSPPSTATSASFRIEMGFAPTICSYDLASATRVHFLPSTGGTRSIGVIASGGCAWSAVSNDSWIVITSAETGAGNSTVSYEFRENFTGAARQGSISLVGQSLSIIQDGGLGAECNYSITPHFESFAATGGSGTISVMADVRCAWQAVSSDDWLVVTSGSAAIGNGTILYSVLPHNLASGRNGTITAAGQVFSVKQKGN